ncbi:MAG: hypothetical protein QM767_18040 [Anaeromyxobacter sp.]
MRKLLLGVMAAALLAGPVAAWAGPGVLELSAGSGFLLEGENDRIPTNLMLTGGLDVLDTVKLELGVVYNLDDVEGSKSEVDLRPMVVVAPPLFPLYLRGIVGVTGLKEGPTAMNYGGALGWRLGALGLGVFIEAGAMTRKVDTATGDDTLWIGEGRIGGYWD